MDRPLGKTAPLVNGSVYDLAAMYSLLIEGRKLLVSNEHDKLLKALNNILDNGYTYEEIRKEILTAYNTHEMFPFYKFKSIKQNGNLLKQGVRYYHKELNIMSTLKPVCHDIDSGTITSQGQDYWIEPRASYTIDNLLDYMYSKGMVNMTDFPRKRLYGLMPHLIEQYGLEIVLFMIEYCARCFDSNHEMFSMRTFNDSRPIAAKYLEEIKNNCAYSGGVDYVPRERMLLD